MLTATCDFTASVDGARIAMKKGDVFVGTAKAGTILQQHGMLEKKKPAKKEKNDD